MPRTMRVDYPGAIYHVKGSVQQNVIFPWDAVPPGECTDHW